MRIKKIIRSALAGVVIFSVGFYLYCGEEFLEAKNAKYPLLDATDYVAENINPELAGKYNHLIGAFYSVHNMDTNNKEELSLTARMIGTAIQCIVEADKDNYYRHFHNIEKLLFPRGSKESNNYNRYNRALSGSVSRLTKARCDTNPYIGHEYEPFEHIMSNREHFIDHVINMTERLGYTSYEELEATKQIAEALYDSTQMNMASLQSINKNALDINRGKSCLMHHVTNNRTPQEYKKLYNLLEMVVVYRDERMSKKYNEFKEVHLERIILPNNDFGCDFSPKIDL